MPPTEISDNHLLDHRIVISVSQAAYRAYSEIAWMRRMSMSELGRETFEERGLFEMPQASRSGETEVGR